MYFGLNLAFIAYMKHFLFILFAFLCFNVEAQQTDVVDFKRINANIMHRGYENVITGQLFIDFQIKKNTDTIFLDAINSRVRKGYLYKEGSKEPDFRTRIINSNEKIFIIHNFKKNKRYKLYLNYGMTPKKTLYLVDKGDSYQIWTQGQGKYTSNWLPSIDDMNDKIEFDLTITQDKDYTVVANGKLTKKQINESTITWHYDMQQPMSSYLVALAIGEYNKKEITSKSGIPIELYYYPKDSSKVEPTYRYTKQVFDFLEEEIGVPYPWQNYKQVPVKDFLYSGMENTSCTIFSDDFMIDDLSFIDKNYVNVNAHELAHQWFGDLVTETSGTHHWLQEGFATYYALLAERDVFGDDYYYNELYKYYQELVAQDEAGQSTALLNPKSSSTTFYKKGAWVLHMLRKKVGNKAFKIAVKNYLNQHAFKNVETSDFIGEVEKASGQDLTNFVHKWLESNLLPINDIIAALEDNQTTSFLLTMQNNPYLSYRTDNDGNYIPSSLVTKIPDGFYTMQVAILEEALTKPDYPTYEAILVDAFSSNNLKLRQTLALNFNEIPETLYADYQTLLNDSSYVTKEAALYNLWANFPRKRNEYLEQTQSVYGFNDYNIRTLWLTLAIATPSYKPEKTEDFFNELVSYTQPNQPFQRRQNAFSYLSDLGLFNDVALSNLVEASKHHNWRFKSYAKQLLDSLMEDENYKAKINKLQE